MNKKSSLTLNIFILFVAIFLTLFFLECAVRIYFYGIINTVTGRLSSIVPISMSGLVKISKNKQISYELKPNTQRFFKLVRVKINSRGLRDYEYKVKKDTGVFRIIGLGDSIAFGSGVKLDEIYLKRLEERLNKFDSVNKFEVLNFGVGGYNTEQELAILRERALKYQPDLVILGYSLNDIFSPVDISSDLKFSFKVFFYSHSHLFRLLYKRIVNSQRKISYTGELRSLYKTNSRHWKKQKKIFETFKEISSKNNFKILFLLIPHMTQLHKRHPFKNINSKVIKETEQSGFLVLDLLPFFIGQDAKKLQIYKTDKHPNAKAHNMMADAIYNFLMKMNLITTD